MYGFIFIGIVGALAMSALHDMSFVEVLRWVLMPNVGHVTYTDVPDLTPWATTFWKLVACGFFLTAVAHGIHGVIVILDDYFQTERQKQWIRILNIIVFVIIAPIGLYVIWTA
jgi:succinate dehydrogenase hydrophobic anchor subunit